MPPMVGGVFYEHGHRMAAPLRRASSRWSWRSGPGARETRAGRAPAGLGRPGGGHRAGPARRPHRDLPAAHRRSRSPTPAWPRRSSASRSRWPTPPRASGWAPRRAEDDAAGVRAAAVAGDRASSSRSSCWARSCATLDAGLAIPDFPLAFGRLVPPLDDAARRRPLRPPPGRAGGASARGAAAWLPARPRGDAALRRARRGAARRWCSRRSRWARRHRADRQGGRTHHRPRGDRRGRPGRCCWLRCAPARAPAPAAARAAAARVRRFPAALVSASALAGRAHGGRRLPRADQAAHHAHGGAHHARRLRDGARRTRPTRCRCWRDAGRHRPRGRRRQRAQHAARAAHRRASCCARATGRCRPAACARSEAPGLRARPHRRRAGRPGLALGHRWPRAVALVTWASYLFLYTPLKTRTSLADHRGRLPGALPPVIGWAAAPRHARARRVRPLRDPVPVADPPLPGHRLDLPRGLRAGRPAHAAGARSRGAHHRAPGGGQQPRPARSSA